MIMEISCRMEITQLNRWRPMLQYDETPKLCFEGYVLRDCGKKRRYITYKTAPIDIRLSCCLLQLRNGDIYSLVGELYDPDNSIPPSVKKKFRNGIPKMWKGVAKFWDHINNYCQYRKNLRSFSSSCAWIQSLKESGQLRVSSKGRIIIPSPKLLKGEKPTPQIIEQINKINKHLKFFRTNLGPLFNKTIEGRKPSATEIIKPKIDLVTETSLKPHSEPTVSDDKPLLKNNSLVEVNEYKKVFCVQNNRNTIKEGNLSNINQRIINSLKQQTEPIINNNVCRNKRNSKKAYEKVTKQKYQLRSSSGNRLPPIKCTCREKHQNLPVNDMTKISNEHIKSESISYNEGKILIAAIPKTEDCSDFLTKENAPSIKKHQECKNMQRRSLEKMHLSVASIKPEINLNTCSNRVQRVNQQMFDEVSQGKMQPSFSGVKATNGEKRSTLVQKMEKKSETLQISETKAGPDVSKNNFLMSSLPSCAERSEKKIVKCQGITQEKKTPRKNNITSCSVNSGKENIIEESISHVYSEEIGSHVKLSPSEKQVEDRKSSVTDMLDDKKYAEVAGKSGSETKDVGYRDSTQEKRPSRKINNGSCRKERNNRSSERYLTRVHTSNKDSSIKQTPPAKQTEDKGSCTNKHNSRKEDNVTDRFENRTTRSSNSKSVTNLIKTRRDVKGKARTQLFASKKKTSEKKVNAPDIESGEENVDSSLLSEDNIKRWERKSEELRLSLNEIDELLDTRAPRTLKKRKKLKEIVNSYSRQNPTTDLFSDPVYNQLIDNNSYSSQEWDIDYDAAVKKIVSGNSYDQMSLGSTPPAVYLPEFVNDDNISVRSKSPFERRPCDENDTLRYVHRVLKEKNMPIKRKSFSKEFASSVSPPKLDTLVEANDAYNAFVRGKPMPSKLFDLKHRKKNSSSDDSSSETSED